MNNSTLGEESRPESFKMGTLEISLQGTTPYPGIQENQASGSNSTWNTVLISKPLSAGKEELNFCKPIFVDGVLQIDEETCVEGAKEWEDTLVGFFIDKKLPFSVVKNLLEKKWQLAGQFEMLLDEDLFYFNFTSYEDRIKVLEEGSLHIMGKLFVVKPWTRQIEEDRGKIHAIPLWVNFYKVPKYLWNPKGLSLLASTIGEPQFSDKNTESKKMLSFARVCIEVKAEVELPHTIPIKAPNAKIHMVEVDYVWKPPICTSCKTFGHATERCTTHVKAPQIDNQEKTWETRRNRRREPAVIKNKGNEGPTVLPISILQNKERITAPEVPISNSFNAIQAENVEEFSFKMVAQDVEDKTTKETDTSSCSRVVESLSQEGETEEEGEISDEVEIEDGVADQMRRKTKAVAECMYADVYVGNTIVDTEIITNVQKKTQKDTGKAKLVRNDNKGHDRAKGNHKAHYGRKGKKTNDKVS
ncbi:Rna exonuclease [Thalictrum thalictroides]|uniref:Rna exonuclease n=1 Tax=Thalictrum thalictroides TaxID=46969 RepID=A0A7J6X585_THATH|nr:Rna exonuclease [Thalictrum thalictroides]